MREPTAEEADRFVDFMSKRFDVRVIDKNNAAEMRAVASFLSAIGVIDKEEFLKSYTTTIGQSVYMPATLSPWARISVLPHEIQHTLQFRKDGFAPMSWAYLTDQEQRALMEVEGYTISSEMNFWRYGQPVDPWWVEESLRNYNIDDAHRAMARRMIEQSNLVVAQGGIQFEPSRVAIAWLDANLADIRTP